MGEWTSRKQSQPTIVCVPNDTHTHNKHTHTLSFFFPQVYSWTGRWADQSVFPHYGHPQRYAFPWVVLGGQ